MKQIVVTLDRFEGDWAVLRHKDHEILWPKEDVPEDSHEGSVITLTAMNEKKAEESRSDMAKRVLNDLLDVAVGVESPPERAIKIEEAPKRAEHVEEKQAEAAKNEEKIAEKLDEVSKKLDNVDKDVKKS